MKRTSSVCPDGRFPPGAYLCAGTLSLMVLGLIYGWSLFKAPLQALFPSWSESDLSTGFTILMGFYAAGGMLSGFLSRLNRPRLVYLMMTALMLAGFLGASAMDPADPKGGLIHLYLTYCTLCGLGTGLGYNLCTSTIVKWYPDRAGFALGTLLMGYGLGSLCMGSIVTLLTDRYGLLNTYRMMGAGVFVLFLACSVLIRQPAQEQTPSTETTGPDDGSYTPAAAVKTVSFWLLMAWAVIVSASFMIVIGNAASIIAYFHAPAILGMVVSITNGVSRVISGSLMDRFGFRRVSTFHNLEVLLSAALMLLGCQLHSVPILIVGLLLSGLGFGCTPTTQAYYLRRRFGQANFSTIYSFTGPGLLLSSVLGSSLSGVLQDLAPEGAMYTSSLLLMLGLAVVGVILGVFLRRDNG